MQIRLIPPPPHSPVLYGLTFPSVLFLPNIAPGATVPAAWSSQLQIITSFLQLEPPSNIHMLDRAVGVIARTREVSMDIPQKEFVVEFIDGQVVSLPMSSDCVRMLSGVVLDIKGSSESESQQDIMEDRSAVGSAEDTPSGSSSFKPPRPGKHKRQRSLLFSLMSSLVPKSFSSLPSPPPTAPPRTPLPPVPVTGRVTLPILEPIILSSELDPDPLRRRARATLVDVWRRHIISALSPQDLPAAGYAEWTLISLASKAQAELESMSATFRSHSSSVCRKKLSGNKHRRAQSESRNALDFGDRRDDYGSEHYRASSPFPGVLDAEDADRVVYPRRAQADEWGVRYVNHSGSFDEVDVFAVDFNGHNESLLGEQFMVTDDWDDNEPLAFELDRLGRHNTSIDTRSSNLGDGDLHPTDYGLDGSDDGSGPADMAFDMSRTPLVPSDVNDDEESNDSQFSLRTPEEGDELPLHILQGSTQLAVHHQPPSVTRVTSSRPRSRNASTNVSSPTSTPGQVPRPSTPTSLGMHDPYSRDPRVDELIYLRYEYLERICTALEVVRNRAHEEGWRLVRATIIGAKSGWLDTEMEESLEIKAKRRAWSSGIKIHAPYPSTSRSVPGTWEDSFLTPRPLISPPGLAPSTGIPQSCGPIVPTGLALGIPLQSSPLAMYAWSADDGQTSTRGLHGILNLHGTEATQARRSSRVTFADSVTRLFPVCEDESENSFEPAQVDPVGFPQVVPHEASLGQPEIVEGPAENEEDSLGFSPSRPRERTKSMYMIAPIPTPPSSPVLPMFRPNTPPPSYQTAVGEDLSTVPKDEEGVLDTSALLLQPLPSPSIGLSGQSTTSRSSLGSNPSFVPRPRAISLPTIRPSSNTNKIRRTSFQHKEDHYDLTQAYALPPPEGPLAISATPAPHEQYPRYAHVRTPISVSKKGVSASILGKKGREVVFEQAGSEFTVGLEVALGRAEEGRVVW